MWCEISLIARCNMFCLHFGFCVDLAAWSALYIETPVFSLFPDHLNIHLNYLCIVISSNQQTAMFALSQTADSRRVDCVHCQCTHYMLSFSSLAKFINQSKPKWMILNGQIVGGSTVYCVHVDAFPTCYHIAGWHSLSLEQNWNGWYRMVR